MTSALIIDDDAAVCATARIILETNGFEVASAADGPSGIDAIKNGKFDLVICDLFLPKMNGLEAIKAIRKIKPNTPVIAASGFMFGGACPEMPNFDAMAAEVGATATLYKPFKPRDLLQAIEKALAAAAPTRSSS
jgi:CheY-like chemotaxis protein